MGAKPIERIDRHKNGSIKAKGHIVKSHAYFENGKQTGEWTTYDARGKVAKVTK